MRSTRYRDADGLAYLVFGIFLILCGARTYIGAKVNPFPAPGISNPLDDPHFLGSPMDWLLGLVSGILAIAFARLREIIEWVKGRVTYPRTGYVATPSGSRELEFGHVLMMAPVFVLIVGAPFAETPFSHRFGLWTVAASFLMSFAGVLKCRKARVAEFLYLAFPAAAFVVAWHFRRPDFLASLFTMQGAAFVLIGLIHLYSYLRNNPRSRGETSR